MPKIKVFTSNLGFYETAVAARSQKMALAHWGVNRDLFREGSAKETNDPKAVGAAMRKVGMVVRRPIGSSGPFEERAEAERTLLKTRGFKPRKPKPSRAKPANAKAKPRPEARSKRRKR
jgi:colicin import membrane protein